jgi:glycosyltransferase involved in cell wall biosynthesis
MRYYKKDKKLLFRIFAWIEEVFIPKKVDKVITPTDFGKKYLIDKGITPEKIFVLNELVDRGSFYDGEAQRSRLTSFINPKREKIVIWHGVIRHYQVDAIVTIMKGMSLAQKEIQNLKLLIAGPIEDMSSKEKLFSLANQLKISVKFTGRVPASQIPSILNSAHIGVQALPNELFLRYINGVKLAEYICAGLPVLCSNLEGPAELVRGNGFLFKPNDSEDLADKLLKILRSDYQQLIESSNRIAEEEFSEKAIRRKIREMERFLKWSVT